MLRLYTDNVGLSLKVITEPQANSQPRMLIGGENNFFIRLVLVRVFASSGDRKIAVDRMEHYASVQLVFIAARATYLRGTM